jgi:alpha-tubulin suppressor-like RCC1 family protein
MLLLGSLVMAAVAPIDVDNVNADAPVFDLIASSDYGTCAGSTDTGGIACWGTASFVNSVNIQELQAVVVGDFHACALDTDGHAFCWGNNQYGQLGNGAVSGSISPIAVSGDYTFSDLAAGNNFTCGIRIDGTTLCWGRNQTGELGTTLADGATFSNIPVAVNTGEHFASLALGNNHACGLNLSGIIYCWGHDTGSLLGNPNGTGNAVGPRIVASNEVFDSISAGRLSSCGLTVEGRAYCWGYNNYGQLGDGSFIDAAEPTAVASFEGNEIAFTELSIGQNHVCGISSGRTYCWGSNSAAQLGNDRTLSMSSTPVLVEGANNTGVVAIAAGGNKTCFLSDTGVVFCFGDNSPSDHLGTGDDSSSYIAIPTQIEERGTPVVVTGAASVSSRQAEVTGEFNPLEDGSSYAYFEYSTDPVMQSGIMRTDFPGTYGGRTPIAINAKLHNLEPVTTYYYRIVAGNRMGLTFGEIRSFQTGQVLNQTIDARFGYGCALVEGHPYCWGNNNYGSLGIGRVDASYNYAHSAIPVNTDKTFVSISVGEGFACGIDSTQDLYCWGRNSHDANGIGSLGIGVSVEFSWEPIKVQSQSKFLKVDLGTFHGCAIDTNGKAHCWGSNQWGQVGVGDGSNSLIPVEVPNIPALIDVSSSHSGSCGAGVDGDSYCWGNSSPSLQSLASAPAFESVEVNDGFTCGLSVGELWCIHSQGNQTFQQIAGAYTRVVASGTRVCGVMSEGTRCWRQPVSVGTNTWSYQLDSFESDLFDTSFDNAMCGKRSNGQYYCTDNGTGSNTQHSTLRALKFGQLTTIESSGVGEVSTSGSTITASVNANWLRANVAIEYSMSPDFSPSTIIQASTVINPEDTNVSKTWTLAELYPRTTYYYRIVASNILGTVNSATAEFRTAGNTPALSDVQSTNVAQNTAQITAIVASNQLDTDIQVEISTSSLLQDARIIDGRSIEAGESAEEITINVSGLTESTTYYYRLTATNELGSSSSIGMFTSRDPVGISINSGDVYTNTQEVLVSVSWPLDATGVLLSNDGGFTSQIQFSLQESISWRLRSAGDYRQPRTVYLKFILADGSRTAPYVDDIMYDPLAPVVSDAKASLLNTDVVITTTAIDNESGIHKIAVDAGDIILEKDFASEVTVAMADIKVDQFGQKVSAMNDATLKVRVQDYAGNWSGWRSLSVNWLVQNAIVVTPKVNIPVMKKSITQKKILKAAQIKVRRGDRISFKILKPSKKSCRVVSKAIQPLRNGLCVIKVIVRSSGKKKMTTRTVTFEVVAKKVNAKN